MVRTLGFTVAVIVSLVAWGARQLNQNQPAQFTPAAQTQNQTGNYKHLAALDYKNGSTPVITVGHDHAQLNMSDWAGPKILYGNLDSLNRTTTNVGYLNRQTLIHSAGRPSQNFEPTGWHNRYVIIDGKRVNRQNRGHLIAYTLSGNLSVTGHFQAGALGSSDNPKNLATQTEFANQVLMQPYEEQVRQALENGAKVIYRVTTVFRGQELMPRGYWLQAKSDGGLDFNVYIFNVQSDIRYDYATGRSVIDHSINVPEQ
ncbi:DNA-entry nuclease [Lacticaseibacillus camelliae DSM 22697 = JCM 13995]|uniref:DNA-entry nuclease n=2 Tax=Lacticaseibacillus camelliae TaxID=381742 RepID=A0A0R2F5D1_9LACO|nr:DNA-entry nuclease [Lacticaseibacillus camelliae DSM 22697 = JCM 13995]